MWIEPSDWTATLSRRPLSALGRQRTRVIYCFDTSAINRLVDDLEREPIVQTLLAIGSFRITAYNVIEVAKTTGEDRRTRLMSLLRRLSDGKRPLDRPNTILLTYASAHAQGASSAKVNADENLDGLWTALNAPDLIDEEARGEALTWASQWEEDFSDVVAGDRNRFQALFQAAPTERPRTTAITLRAYLSKKGECRSLIGDVYQHQTGKPLTDSGYNVLVREPVWALYFVSYAYAIHQRSVRERNFSPNRNAGAVDLGQAVYLTMCDRFVTADRAQYRALRLLNVLNKKRRTEVLEYDRFRTRLLVFP